jgi:flagellar hook-associated protein 1
MTDLLSIGSSGLRAYARALATVSDNVANAQTPGYARRSIHLQEQAPTGDPVLYRNQISGNGVIVAGVDRSVNAWLIEDARLSGSDADRASARLGWLSAAERAIDDGPGGIGESLTSVFNAADLLSSDPGNTVLRAGFLQSVDGAAVAFRRTANGLASASQAVARDGQARVDQLNTDLTALGRVNEGLNRARGGSTNQASLLDERDRLIDQISSAIDVAATFGPQGNVTLRAGGQDLVSGSEIGQVGLDVAGDGRLGFSITLAAGMNLLVPASGYLAGLSAAAGHIADQRARLDTVATQFVADLNTAHQAGRDSAGNPGTALMTIAGGAASLTALALMPDAVAAADGVSVNGNILAFSALRGAGGAEANWANLVASQSQNVASARADDAAAAARKEGAFGARDDVSAVDLDHEAAELLRFQQAYDASARVIQVARETMQSVLNIF